METMSFSINPTKSPEWFPGGILIHIWVINPVVPAVCQSIWSWRASSRLKPKWVQTAASCLETLLLFLLSLFSLALISHRLHVEHLTEQEQAHHYFLNCTQPLRFYQSQEHAAVFLMYLTSSVCTVVTVYLLTQLPQWECRLHWYYSAACPHRYSWHLNPNPQTLIPQYLLCFTEGSSRSRRATHTNTHRVCRHLLLLLCLEQKVI